LAKYNSKNKNQNFEEITFSNFIFLQGDKENFEEYLLILEYAKLSFPILNNYLGEKHESYSQAMVVVL
jgi:hypothetical protein